MDERTHSETGRGTPLAMRRLDRSNAEYPAQLREIPDAPEVLYVRGMLVSEEGFSALARRTGMICPRVALVLEGGYNIETLPGFVGGVLAAF